MLQLRLGFFSSFGSDRDRTDSDLAEGKYSRIPGFISGAIREAGAS